MPLSTYLNLGLSELAHTKLTVELADRTVKYPKAIAENILVGIGKFTFPIDFIILDMPEDIKGPLILRRPFLSTAHAKIDVYKRKITLRVGEERIVFTRDLGSKEISTNIGGEFKYLEILKCWSLETSRRLFNTILLINSTWRIYRANIREVSHSNSL
ncbi:putative reverse transcriptase domain-containing protein [Tanacetum coccineum]